MPLIYPLVIRHLMDRCSTIELRYSLLKLCFFILLSFFTTIVINILLPIFIVKISPQSISSSSLSVLASSHILFPADLIAFPYHQELQTKRTYIKDRSNEKNISNGKIRI
jgi:hypothetical protein